jgi:PDZ domain
MKRNRHMWKMLAAGALAGLLLSPMSRANDKSSDSANSGSQQQAEPSQQGYLGVAIDRIDSWLVEHLKELTGKDEGVRVVEVGEGSPAEAAGLKVNDIIVSYDDQKVYTPEQLRRLVEDNKPGREVALGVIHKGKSEKLTATLATRPEAVEMSEREEFRIPLEPSPQAGTEEQSEETWDTFDSMSLTRLDENRFRAEIKYRNEEGKLETRKFEGTREEIRRDILAQKDLPQSERNQLLFAIRMEDRPFEVRLPVVRITPDGEMVLWNLDSDRPVVIEEF